MKTELSKIKLSPKTLSHLHKTVKSFFDSDGENGTSIADKCIADLKENNFSFELWDALGTDELGLVRKNKQLQNLYKQITKNWQAATDIKNVN